jgi:hypothetical protein
MSDLQAYVDTDEKGIVGVDYVEELKKNTPNNHVKGNALLVRKDDEVRILSRPITPMTHSISDLGKRLVLSFAAVGSLSWDCPSRAA